MQRRTRVSKHPSTPRQLRASIPNEVWLLPPDLCRLKGSCQAHAREHEDCFRGHSRGDKPDPRTGGFKEFSGEAVIDESSKALKSVTVDIDTASLWTQHAKLTEHLNSPDFFETREHPKAKFVAKSIAPGRDPGTFTITGDLTLLATTRKLKCRRRCRSATLAYRSKRISRSTALNLEWIVYSRVWKKKSH